MVDTITAGGATRMQTLMGTDDMVDRSSDAFRYGTYAGQAWNMAAMVATGGGAAWATGGMRAINTVSTISNMVGAAEAAMSGDPTQALMMMGQVALRNSGFGCASTLNRAMGAYGTVAAASGGVDRIMSGDIIGGLMDIATAGVSARRMLSCFTGKMLMKHEEGKKRADQIEVGEFLWARSENDPNGPLQLKRVLEKYVHVAPIWNLELPDQVIETTAEHPFYVVNREAWIPTQMLEAGDNLVTDDGQVVPVLGVQDAKRVETVYNFNIEEFHTYFVAAEDWGFSVWAHNDYKIQEGVRRSVAARENGVKGVMADVYSADGSIKTGTKLVPLSELWSPKDQIANDARYQRAYVGMQTPLGRSQMPNIAIIAATDVSALTHISNVKIT
jgi:hypothetical protein